MNYGLILQIILILSGIIILIVDIALLAKRKLAETISITWGIIGIVIIVAGIVLRPSGWIVYMSEAGMILLCILGFCVVYGLFLASIHTSEIIRNQAEMAMNISLLNQEIVELKKEVADKELEISNLKGDTKEK